MNKAYKFFLVISVIFIAMAVLACEKPAREEAVSVARYASFRDIPTVTQAEIAAIEALQRKYDFLSYGMTLSTEAFIENGKVNGYAALLCEWFSHLFGIRFEPEVFQSNETIEMLNTHALDFLGNFRITGERMEQYYMTDAIAERRYSLLRLPGSRSVNQISQERPLRYAFMEGFTTAAAAEWVASTTHCEIFWTKNHAEAWSLLQSKTIDAFVGVNVSEVAMEPYGQVTVETLYPLLFSAVAMATANPELAPVISVVNKAIQNGGRSHMTHLYNLGHQQYMKHKFHASLTDEERQYIANHPIIPFVANYDNYPICFYNARYDEWQGIFFDLLNKIAPLTGMSFKLTNANNAPWPFIYEKAKSGEVPMVASLLWTKDREDFFIWPETTLQDDYYALISASDFRDIEFNEIMDVKVGLAKDTAYTDIFLAWFPDNKNIVKYDTLASAINALQLGEVDMVMATQRRLLLLTHYQELPGYKTNIVFDQPIAAVTGFNKSETVLCSIFDKALKTIDVKAVSDRWMRKTYDYRIKVAEAQRPLYMGTIGLSLMVIALVLVMFYRTRNEEKRLERLVQDRTAELHNSQLDLEDALDRAQSADQTKLVFLANMSHEIRTSMNSIIGFSELALDSDDTSRIRDFLTKIFANAEGLLRIINDILDISKVEAGKLELEKIPFNMHELLSSCRTLIMPKALEKGIMLHFYAEPSMGKIPLGDPTRLRQVLVNLLSNSVKFTNEGVVKIYSDVVGRSENTITIHFEVRDSGIGMTEEQMTKVFEPFTQAETGTTRQYGGTGLGLTIAKNIVELMGGKLSVASTFGVGSMFSFDLTFDTIDISEDEQNKKKAMLDGIKKPALEGEVLLCEDNAMNQQVICEHLARVGLTTIVAENGQIGVEMIKNRKEKGEKQFDLVFMDMHMPVMDGLEASTKILELDTGIPVVAMTANLMPNDWEVYRKSGINDFVGKPFSSQELWRCLLKYFEAKSVRIGADKPGADIKLQKSLQKLFLKDNRNKFEEIVKALEVDDIKLAHRLAHNLKTNSAQVGKSALQEAAADLEQQLKDGENLVTLGQMAILETELNAAVTQIAAELASPLDKFDGHAADEQEEPLNAETARELFEELEPMLAMGNVKCNSFINSLRRIPGSEELIRQIEDFEFESALAALAELKRETTAH